MRIDTDRLTMSVRQELEPIQPLENNWCWGICPTYQEVGSALEEVVGVEKSLIV
jgi:hypothetical protein